MCLILKARIELLDWACFPANRKDQPMDYEKAMQMFLNVAQLDEACLPGGYGNKAHWFVKRGALLYLYCSQDITDLCLQHSTSSCTCDAGHATPAHQHPLRPLGHITDDLAGYLPPLWLLHPINGSRGLILVEGGRHHRHSKNVFVWTRDNGTARASRHVYLLYGLHHLPAYHGRVGPQASNP